MVISKPFTFSPNTTISSSQVNANFDTVYNAFNGGIDATNLATGAVTTAKIADSNVTTAKINDGAVTPVKWTNPYKFSAYRSSAWSTPNNATATVVFNTELFDTNNNYNASTGEYTAPVTGYYFFTSWANWSGASVTSVLRFYIGSTESSYGTLASALSTTAMAFLYLTSGQVVTSRLFTQSTQTGATADYLTRFSGYLVSQT